MANSVVYDSRPQLRRPILIEGLPGVGNIGKIAAELMAKELGAVRYARVYSDDLPPQVLIDQDGMADAARCELWYAPLGDRDVVFVLGDFQGSTPAGQYNLTEYVFRMVLPHDPSLIVTLGGYGVGTLPPAPRVLGAVTDLSLKPEMEAAGIGFYPGEPQGGIVGAAAMFLAFGGMYGIPSMCIMGETSGYIVDARSARNVVNALALFLQTDIDTSDLADAADQVDAASMEAPDVEQLAAPEDLSYIR